MSYTSGQVGFAIGKQRLDLGSSLGSTENTPQTESSGQRSLNALALAITELDSRIDSLEKRICCAMVPQPSCDQCAASEKIARPSTSELVSTIDTQRSRVDALIQRIVNITTNIDI